MNIDDLFLDFISKVDKAYIAFSVAEGDCGNKSDLEVAYEAKNERTKALCVLMDEVGKKGYSSLREYIGEKLESLQEYKMIERHS